MDENLKKKAFKNILYVFISQFISITLSIFMSLVVPKLLGINDFSYWQLFLFYLSYVGFFHMGITDGMYLKIGGKNFDNINLKELSSQFYSLLLFLIIIFVIIVLFSFSFIEITIRRIILIYSGLYMIIANLNWFLGYVFQGTNKVKLYSISVMIDKIIFLLFLVVSFITKFNYLNVYLPFYIFTTFCALIFSMYNARKILLTKPYPFKRSIRICYENAKVGINLTLSSISSLLILGIGRFLIDKTWGIESFGKFSFALSLTNFFLLFIAQISIVLFPTLRQVDENTAKNLYIKFNNYINSILPIVFVGYIPIKIVIGLWLPQYRISLKYLSLMLPICIFDGKTQMINNTYFKVYRKEKELLKINVFIVFISTLLSVISIYIFNNIYFVMIGMIISIFLRSIIGEIYLNRLLKTANNVRVTLFELLYSILFILINQYLNNMYSFIFSTIIFVVYIILTKSYETYSEIISILKKKLT